jgi:hypothetical protein
MLVKGCVTQGGVRSSLALGYFQGVLTGLGGGSQPWAVRTPLGFVARAITVSLEGLVYAKSYTTHLMQLGLKVFSTNSRCRG